MTEPSPLPQPTEWSQACPYGGSIWTSPWVLQGPIRSFWHAYYYIRPRRLTLPINPRVHAFLWWNF